MAKMMKCGDCGRTFEPSELKEVMEYRGEYWGTPAYEPTYYCPFCGSWDYDYIYESEETEDGE